MNSVVYNKTMTEEILMTIGGSTMTGKTTGILAQMGLALAWAGVINCLECTMRQNLAGLLQ